MVRTGSLAAQGVDELEGLSLNHCERDWNEGVWELTALIRRPSLLQLMYAGVLFMF